MCYSTVEELAVIANRVATNLERAAATEETYVPSKQDLTDFAALFRSFADRLDDGLSLV